MILIAAALAAMPTAPLRLATYAYPAYDRRAALAPLARLIESETGRPVTITLFNSPDELASALKQGSADVAMTNLASYLAVSADPMVRPIAMLAVPLQTLDTYRGVLLARRDADLSSMKDVSRNAGRIRYVEVLPGSTSGALVQGDALRAIDGRVPRFASTGQAGTHDGAIEALLAGRAELASLAEQPWRALQTARPADAAQLVELWRSDPLPPGPLVCVRREPTPCARIAAALLKADESSRAAAEALAKGWSETAGARQFIRIRPETYARFFRRPAARSPLTRQKQPLVEHVPERD